MSDWYDKGYNQLLEELEAEIATAASNQDRAVKAYAFLNNIGLIDYDIEKEIIGERYGYGEEE
jgi:hypothetical protein